MADNIQAEVIERFSRIAKTPEQERKFPVGAENAKALGYAADEIDRLPPGVKESFAGVGNPLSLGQILPGQTVLDLGCGAGLDCVLAARAVGPTGEVIGVDMTEAMIEKARRNADALGIKHIEFARSHTENLPLENESVDVAISNGVFNLCPDKPQVLREVFRVLRPGGQLQMADMLLEDHVTTEELAQKGTWSD